MDFAIRFNDFTGGAWGDADPARQETNKWQGRNVTLYASGLLGPHDSVQFQHISPDDQPDNPPVVPGPMGYTLFGDRHVIAIDRLRSYGSDGQLGNLYAPYPSGVPGSWVDFAVADGNLYSIANGILHKHVGFGTTPITTPTPLVQVVRWGLFLVAVDRDRPGRLWHSAVTPAGPQWDTWDANNYLFVDDAEPITALLPIYNTLYVGKRSGWWAVTGVLGDQSYVRQVSLGNGPDDPRLASITTDNRLIYLTRGRMPATFNGVTTYVAGDFKAAAQTPTPSQGVAASVTKPVVYLSSFRGAGEPNVVLFDPAKNRYEFHDIGIPQLVDGLMTWKLGGLAPTDVKDGYIIEPGRMWAVSSPQTVDELYGLFSWEVEQERSHRGSLRSISAPAWLAPSSFRLPIWLDGQGRQVLVRSLVIQFRKWKAGAFAGETNVMAVRVQAEGGYERPPVSSRVQRWEEPRERAQVAGVDDSWRVGVGDQGWGNGFSIHFDELAGLAIREVIALCEVRTTRT